MTDCPIIFSAPMVRALLDGTKTQTRRVLKPELVQGARFGGTDRDGQWLFTKGPAYGKVKPPYAIGDRLWVRESWQVWPDAAEGWDPAINCGYIRYQANNRAEMRTAPSFDAVEAAAFTKNDARDWDSLPDRYRPSIHMPRWASRLTLIVTDVRVERLLDISEEDARAEGCSAIGAEGAPDEDMRSYVWGFSELWESIHGPDTWCSNPWVVAVSFEVHQSNIDQLVLAQEAA